MFVIPAYAKVNLALEVIGRRPDGFHEISSVVALVDWHDLVGVSAVAGRSGSMPASSLRLTGRWSSSLPQGDDNLALRAARALVGPGGIATTSKALDIWVDKCVPAQAGLGGGSADAAAVLRAGAALLDLSIRADDLGALAASLGSDVPALLCGGVGRVGGRGEQVRELAPVALHMAIAIAGRSATGAVYAAVARGDYGDGSRVERLSAALDAGTPIDGDDLGSGLEPAAVRTVDGLGARLSRLRAATPGHRWHLTGSGGAAFALADSPDGARTLASIAQEAGCPSRACRTVTQRLTS